MNIHNYRFRVLLITVIILFVHGKVFADNGIKMHRTQARERASSGWYLANSTNGRFSVLLPLPFNDFSVPGNGKTGVSRIEVVGTKSGEGIKFIANRIFYEKEKLIKHYFANFAEGKVFPEARRRMIKVKNYPAVDIAISNSNSGSMQRAIMTTDSIILLIVEWPNEYEKTARALADNFLTSINIDD